ncbi:MAG: RHS repeat-associated core domain-containing protein [Lachnospiraceae bacterium]|nr:RHS repeat-associated core domain-containing protein [Lachnospiraceae bacterium]
MYYHDGTGAVYKILGTIDSGGTNLENYDGNDVKFVEDKGSYKNGDNISSKYKFINADYTTAYFGEDGRLLGIKDRFNNEIKFRHTNKKIYDKTYPLISQIEDSIGRSVTFTYTENNIELTITAPGETDQITITYERVYRTKEAFQDGKLIDTYDYPTLFKVIDPVGRITYYENYYYYNNNTHPNERYSYATKNLNSSSSSADRYLLGSIVFAGTRTRYEYEKVVRNLGAEGATDAYRVKARYDQFQRLGSDKTTVQDWEGNYNRVNYTYSGDCTGYPAYKSEDMIPNTYEFWSEETLSNGVKTRSTFNGAKQQIQSESSASNKEKKVVKNLEFDSNFKFKPTRTEVKEYAADGTVASTLYIGMAYTDWGGLLSATLPLTQSQFNDANVKLRYTTTYSYENSAYPYFMTKKQWYQNDTKLLTESYSYDSSGRIASFKNAKGETISYSYNIWDDFRIDEIERNLENGKTLRTTLEYGSETGLAYPSEITNYYTNEYGGDDTARTSKSYDMLLGLVRTETDNENKTTSYTYDKIGRLTQKQLPDFSNNYGESYSVAEKYIYTNGYNANYMENGGYPYGTTVESCTVYTNYDDESQSYYNVTNEFYDPYGNLRNRMSYNSKWINDAKYSYDTMLRVISSVDAEGNKVTASYNAWGKNNETTDILGNLYVSDYDVKNNKIISFFVAKSNIAGYRANPSSNMYKENYNEVLLNQFGRAISRKVYQNWPTLSGELSELYQYDIAGNLIGYTDPKRNLNEDGYTKSYQYDELNRVIGVKDALNQMTNVSYTVLGNIASVSLKENARSSTSIPLYTKEYNELGNMIGKTDPSGETATYAYNGIGLNTQSKDQNGNEQYRDYDDLDQLMTAIQFGADSSQRFYDYSYRNPFGYFDELKYEDGMPVAQAHYYYDQGGRLLQKNIYTGNIQSNLNLQYSDVGNLISQATGIRDSDYFYSNYGYTNNRLTKVQTNGLAAVNTSDTVNATYEYYPDGKLKKITYPRLNDNTLLTAEYVYNAIGRLTSVTNKKGSTVLSRFNYTYDANGNIITVADGSTTKTYTYDKLNRLIEIQPSSGDKTVYTYDLRGNRSTQTGGNYEIVNTSYSYDKEDKLEIAARGAVVTEMEYYADGLRSGKYTETTSDLYVYDLSGRIVSEAHNSSDITANYVWGPDRVLAKKEAGGGEYYYLYNGHGDVVQIIDKSGNIVNNYKYDEWGRILESNETISNPFKYAGEVYDQETGLYYLRARYYDPVLGRFINEDTAEGQVNNPLSLNLYTYCYNNPIMYNDPSGNVAIPMPWGEGIPFIPSPQMAKERLDALKFVLESFLKIFGLEFGDDSTVSAENPPEHGPHPTPAPPQVQSQTSTSTPASPDPGNKKDKNKNTGSKLSAQQMNKYKNQVINGDDVHFKTKKDALDFIGKKFPNFKQEVAGSRSAEGWHFDSHPINGGAGNVDHINIYSKPQGFRVHITWGN